jgi:hypothetical protein
VCRGVDVEIHIYLTSALVGGEWSALHLGRLNPEEVAPGTQIRSTRREGNSWPNRVSNSEPSIVQPVASRYTDYAIPSSLCKNLRSQKRSFLFTTMGLYFMTKWLMGPKMRKVENRLSTTQLTCRSSSLSFGTLQRWERSLQKAKLSLCLINYTLYHGDVWGSERMDPYILDLGTSLRWVVSITPRPLYPRGKRSLYPFDRRLGGPQNRSASTIINKKIETIVFIDKP